MFRALAIYRMGIVEIRDLECDDDFDDLVETLLGTYVEFKQQLVVDEAFLGVGFPATELEMLDIREHRVSESEIPLIEKCFDINIVLLTKGEDGQAFIYRESCYRHDENSERVVYLDIYEDHVSYILNVDGYSGVYCCKNCARHFGQMGRLKRHKRTTRDCSKFPVERFPGGFFKRRLSIFEEIRMLPIENIDQYAADKYYPYLICFDFEAMHEKTDDFDIVDTEIEVEVNDSQAKGKTRFISLHSPISVSVCSNIPGFTEPYHIVKSVSEKRLVVDMIEYMMKIQQSVRLILLRECKNLFEKLNLYLRLLIDKVKTTAQEKTTHVWKDDRLREVEMYLQNFNTPVARTSTRTATRPAASMSTHTARRTPVNPSHRRRCNTTNVFVNDEATVDGGVIVSDDEEEEEVEEEEDSRNIFFQTDLDFIDDRSVESSSLNSLIGQSDQQASQAALSSSLTENCQNFDVEPEYGQTDDDDVDEDDDDPDIDVGVRAVRDRLSRRVPAKNLRKPVSSSVDKEVKKVKHIIRSLVDWCEALPVLGFNSSSYDMRLIRKHFPEALTDEMSRADMPNLRVINGTKGFMIVSNGSLRFLDVKNYLAPGTSLKKFLIQSHTKLQKGLFPYEYLTDMNVLADTRLPPTEKWFSKLRGCNVLGTTQQEIADNYELMIRVWRENSMCTLGDFLRWYNNLDVTPMVDACDTLRKQYNRKRIDPFKQGLSSAGLSLLIGMREAENIGYRFPLPNTTNQVFTIK